eukprot:scaffold10273_cov122-Isochrysis_galbana.AAC.4
MPLAAIRSAWLRQHPMHTHAAETTAAVAISTASAPRVVGGCLAGGSSASGRKKPQGVPTAALTASGTKVRILCTSASVMASASAFSFSPRLVKSSSALTRRIESHRSCFCSAVVASFSARIQSYHRLCGGRRVHTEAVLFDPGRQCAVVVGAAAVHAELLPEHGIEAAGVIEHALAERRLGLLAAHERRRNQPIRDWDARLHIDGHVHPPVAPGHDDPGTAVELHPLPPLLRREHCPAAVHLAVRLGRRPREADNSAVVTHEGHRDRDRVHAREGPPRLDANVVDNIVGRELVHDGDCLEAWQARPVWERDQIGLAHQRTDLDHRQRKRRDALRGARDEGTLPTDGQFVVAAIFFTDGNNGGV